MISKRRANVIMKSFGVGNLCCRQMFGAFVIESCQGDDEGRQSSVTRRAALLLDLQTQLESFEMNMKNNEEHSLPWALRRNSGDPVTIAVVGDLILDEYLDGNVDRISPEAPVPVHLVTSTSQTAGGAANAARNIRLAGGQAILFSIAGQDEAYRTLTSILSDDGMPIDGIIALPDRTTVRKTRITASHQQLVRIDWEKIVPITNEQQDQLLQKMKKTQFDGLLVSDYGKGALPERFLREAISLATSRGVPVVVDPKGRDFSKYKGATVVTPNLKEASDALDIPYGEQGEVLGRSLQTKFGLNQVLVTMSAKGMVLVRGKNEESLYRKPEAREVYDVSGAGDAVAAILALSLASGTSDESAIKLASLAAGRVVEKWGTQPIYESELIEALHYKTKETGFISTENKIMTIDKLIKHFESNSLHSKEIVFTNGCFDILHVGHLTYLEKARLKGDLLVVGLNSDQSISRLKGPTRPVIEEKFRARLLAGLACVDYVVKFEEDTPLELIKAVKPKILVKGADWSVDKIVGGDFVLETGGRVETVELVPELSTTRIIEKAKQQGAPK